MYPDWIISGEFTQENLPENYLSVWCDQINFIIEIFYKPPTSQTHTLLQTLMNDKLENKMLEEEIIKFSL
jgi:hypothetical protein